MSEGKDPEDMKRDGDDPKSQPLGGRQPWVSRGALRDDAGVVMGQPEEGMPEPE